MRRLLVALLVVATFSVASAQQWSASVRYELGDAVTLGAALELPAVNLAGFRAGPTIQATGWVGPTGYGGTARAGLSFAFVPRDASLSGGLVDVYYLARYASSGVFEHRLGVALVIVGRL